MSEKSDNAHPTADRREVLANSMCRHSITADWFEKADEVLADLHRDGWQLIRLDDTSTLSE